MTVSATEQKTMKRVVVDHYGGPEVLKVVQDDVPQPGPGEVRVKVLAAGVSFTDASCAPGRIFRVPLSHRSRPATSWSALSKSSARAARGCGSAIASAR
jgi:hypothetical protein